MMAKSGNLKNLNAEAIDLLKRGKYRQAVDLFQRLLIDFPDESSLYCNLGMSYMQLERWDDAKIFTSQYLKMVPQDSVAWIRMGIIFRELGALTQSIDAFRRATKMDRGRFSALKELGTSYLQNRQYLEAKAAFKEALNLRPASAGAWCGLGQTYERRNKQSKRGW